MIPLHDDDYFDVPHLSPTSQYDSDYFSFEKLEEVRLRGRHSRIGSNVSGFSMASPHSLTESSNGTSTCSFLQVPESVTIQQKQNENKLQSALLDPRVSQLTSSLSSILAKYLFLPVFFLFSF